MKTDLKIFKSAGLLVALLFAFSSCQDGMKSEESKEVAEEVNEEKFDTNAGEKNAEFVVESVAGNYYEIALAKHAQERSSNAEIKSLAKTMEADHTAVLNKLKTLAQQEAITIPNDDATEANKKIKDWADKDPADFDKSWTNEMIDKHRNSINKMESALNDDKTDPDIKNLINDVLPTVRTHLEHLEECKEKLK